MRLHFAPSDDPLADPNRRNLPRGDQANTVRSADDGPVTGSSGGSLSGRLVTRPLRHSRLTISPPARVPIARQTGKVTVFCTERTEPSINATLTKLGW